MKLEALNEFSRSISEQCAASPFPHSFSFLQKNIYTVTSFHGHTSMRRGKVEPWIIAVLSPVWLSWIAPLIGVEEDKGSQSSDTFCLWLVQVVDPDNYVEKNPLHIFWT